MHKLKNSREGRVNLLENGWLMKSTKSLWKLSSQCPSNDHFSYVMTTYIVINKYTYENYKRLGFILSIKNATNQTQRLSAETTCINFLPSYRENVCRLFLSFSLVVNVEHPVQSII